MLQPGLLGRGVLCRSCRRLGGAIVVQASGAVLRGVLIRVSRASFVKVVRLRQGALGLLGRGGGVVARRPGILWRLCSESSIGRLRGRGFRAGDSSILWARPSGVALWACPLWRQPTCDCLLLLRIN